MLCLTKVIPASFFFRNLLYFCKRVLLQKMSQLTHSSVQERFYKSLRLCAAWHILHLQHCAERGKIVRGTYVSHHPMSECKKSFIYNGLKVLEAVNTPTSLAKSSSSKTRIL